MTTAHVIYQGDLRTQATHLQSDTVVYTDAPTDNHGKGEAFSPTDMLASSLASCMLTIMGIKAEAMGVDINGVHTEVTKMMAANPRRVSEVHIRMTLPAALDDRSRKLLQQAALSCPVAKSLHPDLLQHVEFVYE